MLHNVYYYVMLQRIVNTIRGQVAKITVLADYLALSVMVTRVGLGYGSLVTRTHVTTPPL